MRSMISSDCPANLQVISSWLANHMWLSENVSAQDEEFDCCTDPEACPKSNLDNRNLLADFLLLFSTREN